MPRKSIPSTTLLQAVRRHFGLQQQEMATYLGVSEAMIGHIEAGRKGLPGAVLVRLTPLALHLPAALPPAPAPADGSSGFVSPAAGPLEARLDYCRHRATRLRRELRPLLHAAEVARRWQQALPALLADAAPGSPAHRWLLRRQEQATADLDAEASARYHLLRLRAEALETEAAALAALLGLGPV